MAQHVFVGRNAPGGNAGEQAGLEPAAELIAALHVQIGGPMQLRALLQHRHMGGAGVEPDVHDVLILLEFDAAALAGITCGKDLAGLIFVPGVAALAAEQIAHRLDGLVGDVILAALLAVESRDGNAPGALAADAPVATVAHHAHHAVMAPAGEPLYLVDGLINVLLEGVDGAEPLIGGPEDDGAVAAPAVRILVAHVLHAQQMAALLDVFQDDLVGVPDL